MANVKTLAMTIICIFFFCKSNYSQEKDSTIQQKDSTSFYKKIQNYSYKRKLTRLAYDAIFVPIKPKEISEQAIEEEVLEINPFEEFEGQLISEIQITTYDPFGYSVTDTIQSPLNRLQKFGNKIHITTRHFIIINKLLFKENEPINPLALSESERILRSAEFINDARIYVSKNDSSGNTVVHVIVHDKWPIIIPFTINDVFVAARFKNKNLWGVGQQFTQYAKYNKHQELELNGDYGIANIDNTYISGQIGYIKNKDETSASISFDRPFYSPLAKWAGGVYLSHSWKTFNYIDNTIGEDKKTPLNNLSYDVWLGKSFKIVKLSKDKSILNQSSNIIIGGRYYANNYLARPSYQIDQTQSNYNAYATIGNVGFSIQKYYKDKYIYRFGANEDVPEGIILLANYGILKHEFKKLRYYLGFEIARAKHFKFGYLSSTITSGVFFNKMVDNDFTVNYRLFYFSNLLKIKSWFMREFLTFKIVHGEHKLAFETIQFTSDELYGFENKNLTGNSKITLNSETVTFLPYNLIGFKFAPVMTIGIGIIGDPNHHISNSNLYQAYTIGVMVRNENLLSSTFQFTFGAYPFLPDGSGLKVKYNPIGNFTLRVRAFAISKPSFVSYL